jgi:hypothetical protein
MTNIEVADYLRANIDWARFARQVKALSGQCNDRQWRFAKGLILELSFEMCASGKLKYVAQLGTDYILVSLNNISIEFKFEQKPLFGKRGNIAKNINPTLMNSRGTNKHVVLPSTYADYLIYATPNGALLFDKPTVSKHLKVSGDSITGNLPSNAGVTLADPQIMNPANQVEVDIINPLMNMIRTWAQNIK